MNPEKEAKLRKRIVPIPVAAVAKNQADYPLK